MGVKRLLSLFMVLICLLTMFSSITAFGASADVVDGEITIDNGKVTLKGPQNITGSTQAQAKVIEKSKAIMVFIGGLLAATSVLVFIFYFLKLGMISNNPRERKEVVTGLLISGVSAAMLGSVTLIVGLFYGMFK